MITTTFYEPPEPPRDIVEELMELAERQEWAERDCNVFLDYDETSDNVYRRAANEIVALRKILNITKN